MSFYYPIAFFVLTVFAFFVVWVIMGYCLTKLDGKSEFVDTSLKTWFFYDIQLIIIYIK